MNEIENFFPINLPSRCLPYEGVNPNDITVRAYQGRDEVFLAEINPTNLEHKYLHVLKSVLRGIDPEILTIGDMMYVVAWEYAKSYTNLFPVRTVCSHCMKQVDVQIDMNELDVIQLPEDFNNRCSIQLSNGKTLKLRLLTIADEISAQAYEECHEDGVLFRLAKSMVDDDNILHRIELLSKMPIVDTTKIRAFHEQFNHGPDLNANFVCPLCEKEGRTEVPFCLEFFYPRGASLAITAGKRV
jgi:hypothetical protein